MGPERVMASSTVCLAAVQLHTAFSPVVKAMPLYGMKSKAAPLTGNRVAVVFASPFCVFTLACTPVLGISFVTKS